MDTPPPAGPYQPADLDFAADLLNRGEPLDVVREELGALGLSPDAVTLLLRELMFGPEPPESESSRGYRRWCLIGGGALLGLGLVLLVLSVTGVLPTESSAGKGMQLALVGLVLLGAGTIR